MIYKSNVKHDKDLDGNSLIIESEPDGFRQTELWQFGELLQQMNIIGMAGSWEPAMPAIFSDPWFIDGKKVGAGR